jgi:transposase
MTTPTATPTAAAGPILAIDLGRYKSVACADDRATAAARFRTLDATRADLARLFAGHAAAVVVVEACAGAGWVHDLAREHGLAVKVANTNGEAWRFQHLKRKTDRDDARRLAELEALGQLPTVALPGPAARQRRALIAHRQALVGRRVAAQNRIRALFAGQGLPAPRGHRAWAGLGLAGLDGPAKPLADGAPEALWRGMLHLALADDRHLLGQVAACEAALDRLAAADPATRLLSTIPGVGPRTAEAVAAHLGDATRFAAGKPVGAFAGRVPRPYQSGESDRRGRVSKRGPKLLRSALVECAWCALRDNAWALAPWRRLVGRGVGKKKAVVALARKLLVRCWAIRTSGQPGRAPQATAATA